MSVKINIDRNLCKACGICVDLCPTIVFEYEDSQNFPVPAHVDKCIKCMLCELRCPDFAVEVIIEED
jgi:2-oxoglutarate ferredoxin oxidoreductase subunit delta